MTSGLHAVRPDDGSSGGSGSRRFAIIDEDRFRQSSSPPFRRRRRPSVRVGPGAGGRGRARLCVPTLYCAPRSTVDKPHRRRRPINVGKDRQLQQLTSRSELQPHHITSNLNFFSSKWGPAGSSSLQVTRFLVKCGIQNLETSEFCLATRCRYPLSPGAISTWIISFWRSA